MKIVGECETVIDYDKAKADYLSIQANPDLVEDVTPQCDCLIHRRRKNAKQADHSPWVGNNWFAREYDNNSVTQTYQSVSVQIENVIKEEE